MFTFFPLEALVADPSFDSGTCVECGEECLLQLGTVPTHNASFLWAVCIVSVSSDREMKLTSMDCGMVFIERVVEIENFLSFVLA